MSGEHEVKLLSISSDPTKGVWVSLEDYDRKRAERDKAIEQVGELLEAVEKWRDDEGYEIRDEGVIAGPEVRLLETADRIRSQQETGR